MIDNKKELNEGNIGQEVFLEPKGAFGVLENFRIGRYFSFDGKNPYEYDLFGNPLKWMREEVNVTDDKGKVVFTQPDVKKPESWSALALKVVASKYFWGDQAKGEREDGVDKIVGRVSRFIGRQAFKQGYLDEKNSDILRDEIASICLNQLAIFNSPVWFNVGIQEYDKNAGGVSSHVWDSELQKVVSAKKTMDKPQCSACFIQSVEDNMESILKLQVSEATLFKAGSGTGTNRSPLRSSREKLTGGGRASGPVSFMRGYDAYAGIIKSGGKTRRAAKMEILNVDHPDIMDFVNAKQNEEKKAWALIEHGYDGGLNGDAYGSIAFQNCNMSVRAQDEFMEAVKNNEEWKTKYVKDESVCEVLDSKEILKKIAEGTHVCGDPGMQFDTVINEYHTCKNSGRINASNPCFSGDTKIALTDGRNLSFKELIKENSEGKQNYCYTIKSDGHIGIEKIVAPRVTRINAEVIKLILDNNEEIVCTPEHKFMLKSGEFREAKLLTSEDSLMPLYEKEIGIAPKANHKIKKIEKLNNKIEVFDIEVPNTHNFALSAGVFVHNCSEYMFIDDSACNLASINLMKFRTKDGKFDSESFKKVVERFITAMEIFVDGSSYPTEKITQNSHDFRPLGLGYANLGALLMSYGLPYDSEEGRAVSAAVTAIMCGEAYKTSAKIAGLVGPFPKFEENRVPMIEVMKMHREHVKDINVNKIPNELRYLVNEAWDCWTEAIELGEKYGYRNSQATVLAPTGCLIPNSLISTNKGLLRLGSLGNKKGAQWQDVSLKVMTDEGPRDATKFYINGNASTRKIVTASGYEIQGTEKHKIKIMNPNSGQLEWKRFDEVKEGDVVPLALNTIFGDEQNILLPPAPELHWNADFDFKTPATMTRELAILIGYFMGDGSLHSKGLRFCVDNKDEDVLERLTQLVKLVFNLPTHISQREGYKELAVNSAPLVMWWDACGFSKLKPSPEHKGKGYTPFIPDAVLHTNNRKIYCAFLQGLFEADGTVGLGNPTICTASKEFAKEIRTLLLSLGYPTNTKIDISGFGKSEIYVMRLKNVSYNKDFLDNVGFIGARKMGAVASRSTQTGKRDYIYLSDDVIEETAPVGSLQRDAVLLSVRRNHAIPREMAMRLYQDTKHPQLLWAMQFFYDKVGSNVDGGVQPTYDISVPENVTYTANGFISHNTIAFMMDCDTTGIEPDIALVKYKVLSGGGMLKIVNNSVGLALEKLGYNSAQVDSIKSYINNNDTIEGAPYIKDEHLPIFDCAFKPANGKRAIHYKGHIKMMAVTQPFISGAISKTINMPEESTVDEISEAYIFAWEQKLKAVAIYRENSKRSQPLNTKKTEGEVVKKESIEKKFGRIKMPQTRKSITHKFDIAGNEGYITVGLYDDGRPGEIFVTMHKIGSTLRGLMDSWAQSISFNLQYGVPVDVLFRKFRHQKFEPAGFVRHENGGSLDNKSITIRTASSIVDYVAQFMLNNFGEGTGKIEFEIKQLETPKEEQKALDEFNEAGIICPICGGVAKKIGNCAIMCTDCKQTTRSGCGE